MLKALIVFLRIVFLLETMGQLHATRFERVKPTNNRYREFADQLATSADVDMICMGIFDAHNGFFLEHWVGYKNRADQPFKSAILARLTRTMQDIPLDPNSRQNALLEIKREQAQGTDAPVQREIATDPFRIIVGRPHSHLYPLVAIKGWETSWDKVPLDTFLSVALSFAVEQLRDIVSRKGPRSSRLIDTALRVLAIHFAVVDSDGVIECSANISSAWLAKRGDFQIDKERLVARNYKVQGAFKSALDLATGLEAKSSIVSLRTESGPDRIAWISRLAEFSEPRALVILGRGEENPMLRDHLLRLSGLTAAERRVALHVLRGKSLEQTAEETQLAVSTVRSYMKRILAKTSTHRQSEFVSNYQGALSRMSIAPSADGNESLT